LVRASPNTIPATSNLEDTQTSLSKHQLFKNSFILI
jgi:hypothetical protein